MPNTPQSPPKRMTRARTKAQADKKQELKITTSSARAAVRARKAPLEEAGTTRTEDAKGKAIEQAPPQFVEPELATTAQDEDCITVMPTNSGAPKPARGRPRKLVGASDNRTTSTSTSETKDLPRTKRTKIEPTLPSKLVLQKETTVQANKSIAEEVQRTKSLVTRTKKTLDDSSNRPTATLKGFSAKPMRKPKTGPVSSKSSECQKSGDSGPQITSTPAEKEADPITLPRDELETGQEPATKAMQQSPIKLPTSAPPKQTMTTTELKVVEETGTHANAAPRSPDNESTKLTVQSPARRPPQSPFRNAMRESPKRLGEIGKAEDKEPITTSLMFKSPKKINLGKLPSGPSFSVHNQTEFTSSLFASPARRPFSPSKGSPVGKGVRPEAGASLMSAMTTSAWRQPHGSITTYTPAKAISCASLRANRTPKATLAVHTLTVEEREKMSNETSSIKANQPPTIERTHARELHAGGHQNHKPSANNHGPLCGQSQNSNYNTPSRPGFSRPGTTKIHNQTSCTSASAFSGRTRLDFNETVSTTPRGSPVARQIPAISHTPQGGIVPEEEGSEDELQSNNPHFDATPGVRRQVEAYQDLSTPAPPFSTRQPKTLVQTTPSAKTSGTITTRDPMSVLADRFSQWKGASPDKPLIVRKPTRSPSASSNLSKSPAKTGLQSTDLLLDSDSAMSWEPSPQEPSYFAEAMAVREDETHEELLHPVMILEEDFFRASQISAASQEYGDENVPPQESLPMAPPPDLPYQTCTPARVFAQPRQVLHTISRVPLKPAADDESRPSPSTKQRSRSLSGVITPQADLEAQALRQLHMGTVTVPLPDDSPLTDRARSAVATPTHCIDEASLVASPSRTCRSDINRRLLRGAVVFVDVHTAEGADASGIFVDLLQQMGAKCVKSWAWNPSGEHDGGEGAAMRARVGITHVVFKDGGKRTMEKVRLAEGLVSCVGVGWVLE